MSDETIHPKQQENLLDELHTLLEKQVRTLKDSDYRQLEVLTEQTNAVVAEIAKNPAPLKPQWQKQGSRITTLYKKLELMVETEKDTINQQLQKINSGKKTIRAYQHKI